MLDRNDSKMREDEKMSSLSYGDNQHLEDSLFSLTHRIAALQNSLISKIDRSECMVLLQKKPTHSHLRNLMQQFNTKISQLSETLQQKIDKQQKQNQETLNKMMKKLKSKNPSKDLIKPQQLYLQSNQTMFSMVVDEIVSLKQNQVDIEKSIEHRHRVNVSLNNQVCAKLQKLEKGIDSKKNIDQQQTKKIINKPSIKKLTPSRFSNNNGCQYEEIPQGITSMANKLEYIPQGSHDSVRFSHLHRIVQSLQREVASKISIKDLTPIIKKNMEQLKERMEDLKNYSQEAIQSTKKILVHQSQINQQLCVISKVGWWQSFQENDQFAIWNKQISNMVPQVFIFQKDSDCIRLGQQGNYLIKIICSSNCSEEDYPDYIIVGEEEMEFNKEILVHVNHSLELKVPSNGGEMLLMVHKI